MYIAGLVDKNIEFYANKGNLFMIKNGKIIHYAEFDFETKTAMMNEFQRPKNCVLYADLNAKYDLVEALKQFIISCYAEQNRIADVAECVANYENNHDFHLTPREIEFVKYVCEDLADKEIAKKMSITYNTATTYRQNITHKLGVSSKVGIAIKALKYNIV